VETREREREREGKRERERERERERANRCPRTYLQVSPDCLATTPKRELSCSLRAEGVKLAGFLIEYSAMTHTQLVVSESTHFARETMNSVSKCITLSTVDSRGHARSNYLFARISSILGHTA
jgi:hypothetical protein